MNDPGLLARESAQCGSEQHEPAEYLPFDISQWLASCKRRSAEGRQRSRYEPQRPFFVTLRIGCQGRRRPVSSGKLPVPCRIYRSVC